MLQQSIFTNWLIFCMDYSLNDFFNHLSQGPGQDSRSETKDRMKKVGLCVFSVREIGLMVEREMTDRIVFGLRTRP